MGIDFTLTFKISSYLKEKALSGILSGSAETNTSVGKILNRVNIDTDEVGDFITWTSDFLYRIILLSSAFLILLMTNVLTTLALLPMLLGLYMSKYIKTHIGKLQTDKRKHQGIIAAQILDIFSGIRSLRLSNKIEGRILNVSNSFLGRRQAQIKHQMFTELISSLFQYMVAIGTGFVLLIVIQQMIAGSFSVGDLVLFLTYIVWISNQVSLLGLIMARYKDVKISLGNIETLFPSANSVKKKQNV